MTDTLVLSFQTRLSALMESLLKSTVMEVGRLVEESFLEEVQMLKGRLLLSEAKLRERERFRRLRCVDCCRTFTRRRSLHRGPEALTGLDPPACLKQEQVSDGSWKTNTPKDQDKEVNIPKADSEVKEEPVDSKDTQTCLLQAQTHNHSESPNGPEKTPGPQNPDPDLKPSGTSFSAKPEDEEHSTSAWLEAKGGSAAHSSGFHPEQIKTSSPPGSQALRQQSGQREEVVVMLPPDWEETSPVVPEHKSLKKAPRLGAAFSVGLVSYPQPLLKISPQAVQNLQPPSRKNSNVLLPNVTPSHHRTIDANRVETVRKVPPAAKPPPVRQHTDGDDAEERTTHTCAQCGKSFSHLCHLRAHQQIHTGERQFCCSICGRNFTKLSNLKAHRRVHTGERPYFCTDCGKRFTQKCNLKRHQRIHLEMARSKL